MVEHLEKEHHNSAIEELVLNSTSTQFYKEAHNRIYPKIGQIYLEPDNNWGRAPFYSHEKNSPVIHFLLLHLIY